VKESAVDRREVPVEGAQPIPAEIRGKLLLPFVTAAHTALREMAGIESAVQGMYEKALPQALGDIAARVQLGPTREGFLVLSFPRPTAETVAQRILADVTKEVDEALIRDCVGEVANVVVGQAKALLAGVPDRITFSLPQVVVNATEIQIPTGSHALVVLFSSDVGDFALQLFLNR
jgi:CheY-specific phosphatase CheX